MQGTSWCTRTQLRASSPRTLPSAARGTLSSHSDILMPGVLNFNICASSPLDRHRFPREPQKLRGRPQKVHPNTGGRTGRPLRGQRWPGVCLQSGTRWQCLHQLPWKRRQGAGLLRTQGSPHRCSIQPGSQEPLCGGGGPTTHTRALKAQEPPHEAPGTPWAPGTPQGESTSAPDSGRAASPLPPPEFDSHFSANPT